MGLYLGGLIIGRISASEIWGAYFWEGLLSEVYGSLAFVLIDHGPNEWFIGRTLVTDLTSVFCFTAV